MKSPKPWLTPAGLEISLAALREISSFWDKDTWEAYLAWYEEPRTETIVSPAFFRKLSEEQIESIFMRFAASASGPTRDLCRNLLAMLPPLEAKVLRLAYFGGRTFRQIGAILGISHPAAIYAKKRAFTRLRESASGAALTTRRYIGGNISSAKGGEMSPSCVAGFPPPADKLFDRDLRTGEARSPGQGTRQRALRELADDEQRILYLVYERRLPLGEVARELGYGVNLVEQIAQTARLKLERKVIHLETGVDHGAALFVPLTDEVMLRCESFLALVERECRRERLVIAVKAARAYLSRDYRHWTRAAREALAYGTLNSLDEVWHAIPRERKRRQPELGVRFDQLSLELSEICHGRLMLDFEEREPSDAEEDSSVAS